MRAILIPVEGPLEVVEFDNPRDATKVLGISGYAERVRIGQSHSLAVDESGSIQGLPINTRAGVLYGTPSHGSPIYGPALYMREGMTGSSEDMGIDWMDLGEDPNALMERLYRAFSHPSMLRSV